MNVLLALVNYKKGSGNKGRKLKWLPNSHVVQALDKAFYTAFKVSGCVGAVLDNCILVLVYIC